MNAETWKTALTDGELEPGARVHKQYAATVKASDDPESRTLDFVISTGDVDRHGDTVNPEGWDLAEYRKNPVVLWQHDPYPGPIAKAANVRVEDGALKAAATFADRETSALADMAFRLYKGGFMSAVSVGFQILEWTINEDRAGMLPMDITRQALWEYSAVSIPANPNALIEARSAGVDTSPALDYAIRMLDEHAQDDPRVRDWLERTWKATKTTSRYVPGAEKLVGEITTNAGELLAKAGRTLSQANFDKLEGARDAISQVLATAQPQDEDDNNKGSDGTASVVVLEIVGS